MTIECLNVAEKLADDYCMYALSTLNRAIPSVVDGLKVSQRRAIQSGFEQGLLPSKPFRKVARWSGVCTGTLHPHGSASGTIIHLASHADFTYPLVQGHGNLGGHILTGERIGQLLSDDGPAADRYLEARLSEFALAVFDIPNEFLQTTESYDGQMREVVEYVPAVPLALLNAQTGIGTGYATNTASFELGRVLTAIKYHAQGKAVRKVLGYPDFPCYGAVLEEQESLDALYEHGRATFTLQGEWQIRDIELPIKRNKQRKQIVVTAVPNGSAEAFLHSIKQGLEQGNIQDIADIVDESDGNGIRILITLAWKADPKLVLYQLQRFTKLISKYAINNTLLVRGMPKQISPAEILSIWFDARRKVLIAYWASEQTVLNARKHILDGLLLIEPNKQAIVDCVLESENRQAAIIGLTKLGFTELQAEAILALPIGKLTKLNVANMRAELESNAKRLAELANLLSNESAQNAYIVDAAYAAVAKFKRARITDLIKKLDVPAVKKAKVQAISKKPATMLDEMYAEGAALNPPIGKRRINSLISRYQTGKDKWMKKQGFTSIKAMWQETVRLHVDYWSKHNAN